MPKFPRLKTFLQTTYGGSIVVGLLCLIVFSLQLGNRPFATPDEARYVEIPREMVITGDIITPRLNGVKYFEKPPLFYWLQAASLKAFGLQEGPMRLWVVVFAALGCVATYAFGRSVFDQATGLIAAGVLATTALYFSLARLIILDMAVSVCVTIALYCFYQGLYAPLSRQRRWWFYGFSAACGFGVLTKGIMALVVPGPLIVIWLSYTQQWHYLRPTYVFRCLALFLFITVPWHVLVSLKNPEFAYKYFIVEHWLRYTTTIHARYKPVWFFIPILLAGLLPWTTFLIGALKEFWLQRRHPLYSFLWLWIGWVLLFFSLSHSKLIPYILPVFPPLALLIAHSIRQLWQRSYPSWLFYSHSFLMIALSIAGFIIPMLLPEILESKHSLIPFMNVLSGLFLCHGIITLVLIKRHSIKPALVGIGVTAGCMTLVLGAAAPHLQRPSLKPLIEIMQQYRQDNQPIVSFLTYYQDLPLYSQHQVIVVGAKGELEFGTTVEDTSRWITTGHDFLAQWLQAQKQKKIIWAIGRQGDLEEFKHQNPSFRYYIVAKDHGNVLFTPTKVVEPNRKIER